MQSKSGQKTWIDILPKKTYRWLMSTWKDAQHHSLLEKCQSKQYWDITSQLSERLSSKSLQIKKKSTQTKCWRGYREKGALVHCWWECKLVQPLWKTVRTFSQNLELPCDPEISFLGIYIQRKTKTLIQKDTCTPM